MFLPGVFHESTTRGSRFGNIRCLIGESLPRHARELSMNAFAPASSGTHPMEQLTGAVERVTFHSEETGFCVLRVKVRGHRDLVTVVGTAATITPGEYIEGQGVWVLSLIHI